MRKQNYGPVHLSAKISPEHREVYDGVQEYLLHRHYTPRTIETYLHEIRVFLHWLGARHPQSVTAADLRDYQTYLVHEYTGRGGARLSASSQARNLSAVRMVYRYLRSEGKILGNPADSLRLPKTRKRTRRNTLTLSDVRRMIECPAKNASAIRDRAVVYMLAATGVRATSCANLDLGDVDLERREVLVRLAKGNRSYLTFFTNGCGVALREYLQTARAQLLREDTSALFLDDAGVRLNRGRIREIVLRLKGAVGIRKHVHPHLFRHWLCTTLLERGVNVRAVSEIAGHARLSTTTAYTEVTMELLMKTVRLNHPRGSL